MLYLINYNTNKVRMQKSMSETATVSTTPSGHQLPVSSSDILQLLPHKYPFLLLDGVTTVETGSAQGFKNVTINEPFFQGHFPGHPIMPGVLIVEASAQLYLAWVILRGELDPASSLGFFAGMDNVKFKSPVLPGQRLDLSIQHLMRKGRIGKASFEAHVGERLAAKGNLTLATVDR